jgi:hypothetical protein
MLSWIFFFLVFSIFYFEAGSLWKRGLASILPSLALASSPTPSAGITDLCYHTWFNIFIHIFFSIVGLLLRIKWVLWVVISLYSRRKGISKRPRNSIKKLLDIINTFSKVGYKISLQKLVTFLYTNSEQTKREYRKTIPFTIVSKK